MDSEAEYGSGVRHGGTGRDAYRAGLTRIFYNRKSNGNKSRG